VIVAETSRLPLVRLSAVSGFSVTVLAVALQVVPIIDVRQPWVFAAKVATALFGANLLGSVLYRRASRGRDRAARAAMLA